LQPVRDFTNLGLFAWSDPPLDGRYLLRREDVLVYTSEPLERGTDVSGRAVFEGVVWVDAPDADLMIGVHDVHPDGRSIVLGSDLWVIQRLSNRNGPDPEPLTPGEPVEVRVPGTWLHHRFLQGHRIRVMITSSYFPRFARNLNRGEPWPDAADPRVVRVTIQRGRAGSSRLVLPVEQ
jgi:putative CocE/NonD family hydrolase